MLAPKSTPAAGVFGAGLFAPETVARPLKQALATARSVQLDVLRAVAILLVIGAHISIVEPAGIVGSLAWIWRTWGGYGVMLFFTLSGYLVGGLLISEMRRHGSIDIKRFLVRRSLKIFPAYFLFLAYLLTMPTLKATVPLSTLLSDYWANFLFLQNYVGSPAGHTWSLAVEEHFYLTLPLLLLAFIRFGLMGWIGPLCMLAPLAGTAVRMISAAMGDPNVHNFPEGLGGGATHLWIDGLLVGVGVRALAEFFPDRFAGLRPWRWPLLMAGPIMIATVALPMPTFMGVPLIRILPISAIAATAILIGVLHMRMAGWAPSAVAWIGKYSYGIYLWHVTIIGFVTRVFVARIPGEGQSAHWVIAVMAITLAAVLFGAFMSRVIEWPVLALRDRLFPSRSA
jgi:peptidoglycan/LPS O-acetylase OafA/YrhL